jgi:hypothetical protein
MTVNTSINLALPSQPEGISDPNLYQALLTIYNAIRALAVGLDEYTQEGDLELQAELNSLSIAAQLLVLQKELKKLQEHAISTLIVNWGQPGHIGKVTPKSAKFTVLTVTGDSVLSKFGANGKPASGPVNLPGAATDPASTQALVNAIRNLLISFGLGN